MDEPVKFLDEEKMKSVKKKDNAKEDGKVLPCSQKRCFYWKKTNKIKLFDVPCFVFFSLSSLSRFQTGEK